MSPENEVWRPVNSQYIVSNFGRIIGLERAVRNNDGVKILRRRFIKGNLSPHGYIRVQLGGSEKLSYVHRIVAKAFIGKCPDGFTVNHKNFDTLDNSVSNLEYLSIGDNIRHAAKHGRLRRKKEFQHEGK